MTARSLLHETDSLGALDYSEAYEVGCVCVHSSPAPYKIGQDSLVNEDAFIVQPLDTDALLLAVADGVGGNVRGQDASALAIECLRQAVVTRDYDPLQVREQVLSAIDQCNKQLLSTGSGSATTLVVAVITGNEVRPYHVGDSSILVTGQRGLIKQRSTSHSPVGFGLEAGFINDHDALDHEQSHLLLNLIGSSEMRIEVGAPFKLARFDTLLLCSDGVTDNLTVDDIANTIRAGSQERAISSLVSRCREKMSTNAGHPDDLTAALFRRRQ